MKWAIYNLLFAAVYPFLLPGFLLRMLRRGGYAARFWDRFALYPEEIHHCPPLPPPSPSPSTFTSTSSPVWIHAVSVGEVQVAGQLMREWRKVEPGVRFVFSTTSSTGWKMAEREVSRGEKVKVQGEGDVGKVKVQGEGERRNSSSVAGGQPVKKSDHHCSPSPSTFTSSSPSTFTSSSDDILIYNPLDFPNFVKSALKTFRPRAIVLTESEIWPNFIRKAHQYGIPLYLINARVSDRSAPRYKMARWFFGDVFRCFTKIFAQSQLDADRLIAAGAPEDRVLVTGSFKFDVAHRNEEKEKELAQWVFGAGEEKKIGGENRWTAEGGSAAGRPKILLGGSTWPGEDEVLLRIYRKLVDAASRRVVEENNHHCPPPPNFSTSSLPLLIIAPRHFEKADAVEANIRAAGFDCIRRSRGDKSPLQDKTTAVQPSTFNLQPVFLADTTGELMGLYGIADAVFVGKSLCAHGSQNMIEPCLCGKPTFVGPYTENFRPVMSDLLAAKAIVQVADEKELEERIVECFRNPEKGREQGERARATVASRCGVVAKCLEEIKLNCGLETEQLN